MTTTVYAGRFDFEDGGTYCGGWEDGKAHGHGVCTGPKAMGEFSGMWQFGYEVSGIYMWPSGNSFLGQWMSGKRHGLGVEKKQRWVYKGEWSQGFKGRYGVRVSDTSGAKYEGTWANGLQDGYGSETYADGGTYFGQMSQGMRNGYGIRKSVSYGVASRYRSKDVKDSLTSLRSEEGDERGQRERDRRFDENRGGFVLRAKSDMFFEELSGYSGTGAYMPGGAQGGNFVTNAFNSLVRRRRNSTSNHLRSATAQGDNVSISSKIMSKLKKQKSVSDIDEVQSMPNQQQAHILSTLASRQKVKQSFRSMSSNNSVDSRCSNRTAPAGIGHLHSPSVLGFNHHNHATMDMRDDDVHSFVSQDEITDVNCIEIYMGEWKQDKRTGYGIAERSDGLKYEGEWFNNKKNGYGVTTFKDGTKEEGKYKNNVLTTDKKKAAKMLTLRSSKFRQKIEAAIVSALKSGQIAQQRADIALARAVNARTKAHAAEMSAKQARADSEYARIRAHEVAPDFAQPGELKRLPEIILDIDRMSLQGLQPGDSNNFGGLSPNQQDSRSQKSFLAATSHQINTFNNQPLQTQLQAHEYWSHGPAAMPHSSTPPPSLLRPSSQLHQQHQPTPTRTFSSAHFGQDLLNAPRFHNQHSMDYAQPSLQNNISQFVSSSSQMQPNLHPSMDAHHHHHLDNNNHHQHAHLLRNHNKQYSFEEQQHLDVSPRPNNISILQQAQHNSFNMDMFNNVQSQDPHLDQHHMFADLNGQFAGLTPHQQQQLLIIRNQQFLNNNTNNNLNANSSNNPLINPGDPNPTEMLLEQQQLQTDQIDVSRLEVNKPPRRKSLPIIVKSSNFKNDEVAHSSAELTPKNQETYIIENGIKKRVVETNNSKNQEICDETEDTNEGIKQRIKIKYETDETPQLPRKMVIQSINSVNRTTTDSKRVSMPSITANLSPQLASKIMKREVANKLSSERRAELRKDAELQNNTSLRLKTMLKDVFFRNRIFLFIILFNLSLAIWFMQMLK